MYTLKKIFLTLSLFLAFGKCAIAQTNVSGLINTNTTWDSSGSPYLVVGDVTVDSTVTLSIPSNVKVIFTGNYSLYVRGTLSAYGSHFSGEELSPGIHVLWNGIIALSNADISLNSCSLSDANIALDYRQADAPAAISISWCTFRDNICAVRAARNTNGGIISQSLFEHNLVALDGSALDNTLDTTFDIDSSLMRYTNLLSCNISIDTCVFRDNKIAVNQVKDIRRSLFANNGMGIKMCLFIDSCLFWQNKEAVVAFSADISNSQFHSNQKALRFISVRDTSVGYSRVLTSSFKVNEEALIIEPNARLGLVQCNYFDSNVTAIRTPAYLFMRHEDTGEIKGTIRSNVINTKQTAFLISKQDSRPFSSVTQLDSIRVNLNGNHISGSGIYIHNSSASDLNVFYLDMESSADSMDNHLIDKMDSVSSGYINYSIFSRISKTDPSNGNPYYEVTLDSMVMRHGDFGPEDTAGSKTWNTPSCYRNNFARPNLGIKKIPKKEVLLYPNPCQDKINLKAENFSRKTSIHIFSMEGRLVFETTRPYFENNLISCDVTHLPAGIYFLLLRDEQGVSRLKFVKE